MDAVLLDTAHYSFTKTKLNTSVEMLNDYMKQILN